jgi:demethylmenaquinone methyltransferase/2-methoxy-6-polyprenyl-1,4-benzoquinol methylase
MKNEYRRLGKFKDSEFAFQTSRARRWLMNPMKTLQGAGIQPGQTVLEVGCGTGFFTIPAAQLIGDQGCLVAMDALSDFIKQVSKKVKSADLKNVRVVKRDALDTGLDAASIDKVLLYRKCTVS